MPGGNPNWKADGADHKPPGGAGWGGPAKGAGASAFTAATQPSGDAKSEGQLAKAEVAASKAKMRARLEEARMALAEKLIQLAANAESETTQLAAVNAILDRLDGKPVQAISGPEGEALPNVMNVRFVKPE